MTLTITVPGPVRGKARIRANGGQFFMDAKTRSFEAWVKLCAEPHRPAAPMAGALAVRLDVSCIVPASWSAKRRAAALAGSTRPVGKPDLDNVAKALLDPLNGLLWRDDAQVAELVVVRRYAEAPGVVLTVAELA